MGQLQPHRQGPTALPPVREDSLCSFRHLFILIIIFSRSSGEFHTFRLPVPSMWLDILQKVKATGMNAVSVYVHCSSSSQISSDFCILTITDLPVVQGDTATLHPASSTSRASAHSNLCSTRRRRLGLGRLAPRYVVLVLTRFLRI